MNPAPAQIILTVRSNAVTGEKLKLTAELLDRRLERMRDGTPTVIFGVEGEGEIRRYAFRRSDRGLKSFPDVALSRPGVYYLFARIAGKNKTWRSNPVEIFSRRPRYRLWWGEIHGHTALSDSLGTIDEHYRYGRDVLAMDIYAAADHTEFPKMDPMTEAKWRKTRAAARKYYRPHEFVTFLGFEWTSGKWFSNPYAGYGHRCVYYPDDDQPYFCCNSPDVHTPEQLFARLDELKSTALVIPHHPAVDNPSFWVNWDFFHPGYERLVEIYSMWGNSERSEADGNVERPVRRLGGTVRTGQGSHVQDALRKGCRVGFIGGSDAHDGRGGRTIMHVGDPKYFQGNRSRHEGPFYPNGLMAVYAEELTRESVFAAMRQRRTYAATCARIILDFRLNGHWMGEEIRVPSPTVIRRLRVRVQGTADVDRVEIVKNCVDVFRYAGRGRTAEFEYTDRERIRNTDFYYVRVIQKDGEMAWSSPVWVDLKKVKGKRQNGNKKPRLMTNNKAQMTK